MVVKIITLTPDLYCIDHENSKGRATYAARHFSKGEPVFQLDYWSSDLMPIHVTNHSCEPNAHFDSTLMLVASRDIAKDEEITWDYHQVPLPASPWNFRCNCGSPSCIGWVKA